MFARVVDYAAFLWDFAIARRNRPYVLGLVITDICNLACKHCRVANIYHSSMTYQEVEGHLREQYAKGVRYLYLEGGEPYLWRDGAYRLPDIANLAKHIGYYRVHVYTNGTTPLDEGLDFHWVSIDGTGDIYQTIRGIDLEHVLRHVRNFRGRWAVVYTVNTINYPHIREFLQFMRTEFPGVGVMFYFHTPYYGVDQLLLDQQSRHESVATIAECKRSGLPVLNSLPGLRAMESGDYFHPTNLWHVIDNTGDYQCCRAIADPEVCKNCGYSTCAEIALARDWRPGPILQLLRTY
jgi:MoaA/NifB/PqqE/SkfB family radical SAM enzyme